MGSHSYESNCPNCGNDMESIVDTKPIQTIHHACIHCGWYCSPKYEQMSLDELNEQRKDWNENFYEEGDVEICKSALIYHLNHVEVPKINTKKQGLFEKFFNIFSK